MGMWECQILNLVLSLIKPACLRLFQFFYTNFSDLRNKMGELMMVPETYGSNLKIICVTETMFNQ